MIPEHDRGPAWLRDYRAIEADISRMERFAASLRTEVVTNYNPHLAYLDDDMAVQLPAVDSRFGELHSFLSAHREVLASTNEIVHYYRDATGGFATAAGEISANYADADAYAAANVKEVAAALDRTAAARPTSAPGDEPAVY